VLSHDGELRVAAVNLLEHVPTVAVRQADVQQEKVIGCCSSFSSRIRLFSALETP